MSKKVLEKYLGVEDKDLIQGYYTNYDLEGYENEDGDVYLIFEDKDLLRLINDTLLEGECEILEDEIAESKYRFTYPDAVCVDAEILHSNIIENLEDIFNSYEKETFNYQGNPYIIFKLI